MSIPVSKSFFNYTNSPVSWGFDRALKQTDTKEFLKGYISGMAALPVQVCVTPIVIIADVISTLYEGGKHLVQRHPWAEIKSTMYKKIVASTVQQLTFAATVATIALTLFLALKFGFAISSFFIGVTASKVVLCRLSISIAILAWPLAYAAGKMAVSHLPERFGKSQIDIFAK